MTLAVEPAHKEALYNLAIVHEVELAELGSFTDNGCFHIYYHNKTVGLLPLSFLHDGVPQMELSAAWTPPTELPYIIDKSHSPSDDLHNLLARDNICSREEVIRQYDHEVQAGTVLKPLVGRAHDGPSDAAIILPHESREKHSRLGIVIANGLGPRYSTIDTYHMAANATRIASAYSWHNKTIPTQDSTHKPTRWLSSFYLLHRLYTAAF